MNTHKKSLKKSDDIISEEIT